ncbi:MAG TPA: hypothetical protein VF121_05960, partial [Thermoanaerobaculia bacterium]|nr:hypothetical protein [Thermoanaerobaculia bacterium]
MCKATLGCTLLLLAAAAARADVSVVERRTLEKQIVVKTEGGKLKPRAPRRAGSRAAGERGGLHFAAEPAVGSVNLADASGFELFLNSDVSFTTSSSASGAASEAIYIGPVQATTVGGGVTASTLSDAFDGYNGLCLSSAGGLGPCSSGDPGLTIYNDNGPGTLECNGRQLALNPQTVGSLTVRRKVLVPGNGEFARWMNILTNTGGAAVTVNLITSNNLGSDSDTVVVSSSDGDAVAETSDTWVTTFQDYGGTISTDPRLGHVLRGAGAPVGLAGVTFVNGDDNPFWSYSVTLAPGQTGIILNFVTGQPSKAEAAAKASELAGLPPNALQCMSPAEQGQVLNFLTAAQGVVEVPTASE